VTALTRFMIVASTSLFRCRSAVRGVDLGGLRRFRTRLWGHRIKARLRLKPHRCCVGRMKDFTLTWPPLLWSSEKNDGLSSALFDVRAAPPPPASGPLRNG